MVDPGPETTSFRHNKSVGSSRRPDMATQQASTHSSYLRECEASCDTNPECKKVKFGGYVSVGLMVFGADAAARVRMGRAASRLVGAAASAGPQRHR